MFNNKYNELISYFEKNVDKPWEEWLVFDKLLDKQGKQGQVGMFISKTDSKLQYIFKISQCLNFLVYHEIKIMQGLFEISKYCPHFCKGVGVIKAKTEPNRKTKNPFLITSKFPIEREILLCEYIEKSSKFCTYIKSLSIDEDVLYSIIKQTLMGVNIAQNKKKFVHYDLHSNNVMIKKCNKNLVFLYKIDNDNQFCVPTFGYYPVVIDYGFSYIEDLNDGPLLTSLAHTDVGFMSDRFDWVADPKLFLISVSDEIKEKRGTKKAKKLRRIVKNMFYPLTIELDSGWDNEDTKAAVDYVLDIFEIHNKKSKIFKECDYYCIDILQSLIILPLEEQDYSNIGKTFESFINEWIKIENEISNEFYNIFILKEIVSIAMEIRPDYLRKEKKDDAVTYFRHSVYEILNKVSKFCNPKNIHYEKFLCSLLLLSENIEGVLYDVINARMQVKQKEYNKMPLKNLEQIYATIDINLQDTYIYNKDTVFYIIDMVDETNDIFEIPETEIKNINKLHNISRGCYVYDMYKNTK